MVAEPDTTKAVVEPLTLTCDTPSGMLTVVVDCEVTVKMVCPFEITNELSPVV